MKTQAQIAYEKDCMEIPHYHDGTPRECWDNLTDVAKWSWSRPIESVNRAELFKIMKNTHDFCGSLYDAFTEYCDENFIDKNERESLYIECLDAIAEENRRIKNEVQS